MLRPMLVIFDADCGVCQASVAFVRRRDRRGLFEFLGNDQELPEGVTADETEHTVIVLDAGRKYTRAAAVSRILRGLRFWSPLGQLLRLPGLHQLANFGYDKFAKHRHRVSAALGLAACAVPARKPSP